jgi:hypothetical protein
VNKFIWSDQDWNPHTTVEETLQDYARFFIGPDHAKAIAEGILELEENLRGPLLSSKQVSKTLEHFQSLEKSASVSMMQNLLSDGLLRAYYDALFQRLIHETKLGGSIRALSKARQIGSLVAIAKAGHFKKAADPAPYNSYKAKCMAGGLQFQVLVHN